MPNKRELTMRQIRQTLRLASDGISARQNGCMLGVARSSIQWQAPIDWSILYVVNRVIRG
jgi:hypothetical protein